MPDGVEPATEVFRPEEETVFSHIYDYESPIHIYGEPGVGKTTLLERIENEFGEEFAVTKRTIRANYSLNDLFRELFMSLFDELPDDKKEEGRQLAGGSFSTPLGGAGLSFESVDAEASRARFGYRDSLLEISEWFPEDHDLIVCLDNVHELSEDERKIRGAIEEAEEVLPSNVVLVTTGLLTWDELGTSIRLSMFSEEQTVDHLQDVFSALDAARAQRIHEEVGGHPLYIGLLVESNIGEDVPAIPEEEMRREIEDRYFEFLDRDERRVLVATASLHELDDALCARIVSEPYDLDRVAVSDILKSLSTRSIVQTIGRTAEGLPLYKVHDVFREFLQRRSDHLEPAQKTACVYYAEKLIDIVEDDRTLETEVEYVSLWSRYLSDAVIHEEQDVLEQLLKETIGDDRFGFYSSSQLVQEFKTRDARELPEGIVDSLLASIDDSCNMANAFYDEQLDRSWADLLFECGAFTDPDPNLIGYLGRITETDPDFIRQVVENIETDNDRTLRFLMAVGEELPREDAAVVGEHTADWIRDSEAYGDLAFEGLQLAWSLAEQDDYDVVLQILDAVMEPRDSAAGDQLDVAQGMVRYELIETLEQNFEVLIAHRGEQAVDVFESNLRQALERGDDGEAEFEMIVERQSIAALNFVDRNRGDLGEVLLEYYTRALKAWIDNDPDGEARCSRLTSLLEEGSVFRRVGLYLLSEYPDVYDGLVEAEVVEEENYHDDDPNYEFYRALHTGFPYLDNGAQEWVCKIILDGPYAEEDVEDRAAWLAERGDESVSYFEQRIRETWRRDRFCLIRDELDDPYRETVEALVAKHGEPERLPLEAYRPQATGGRVRERGPEETEELREQPAEEVLSTAVEWEPPESEEWNTDESDQMEEQNHLGFSRQLQELIQEDPQRYSREISVLEDAHPRYAESAFRAFRDLVEDEISFSWDSVIELGVAVTASPTDWTSRTRRNLATLINRGIAANHTTFPDGMEGDICDILLVLLADQDPTHDRDRPPEGQAGHGNPVQVAINSVRPMALNAYITFLSWKQNQTEGQLDTDVFEPIEDRIHNDPSLAVRTVIGRRFSKLYDLNPEFVESNLDEMFPRDNETATEQRFIAVWNSYATHNRYWNDEQMRPCYRHAISLLSQADDQSYHIAVKPTAAHVASFYLFEEENLADVDSLIAQFYDTADQEAAVELASVFASSTDLPDSEDYWEKIGTLWDWRLDALDPSIRESETEIRHFLECVRNSSSKTIKDEYDRIKRSLPYIVDQTFRWRRAEEWLADESTSNPIIAINLYNKMVDLVSCDDWTSIARISKEDHRNQLYTNAKEAGAEPLQVALDIADWFAADNYELDREFLETHLTTQ